MVCSEEQPPDETMIVAVWLMPRLKPTLAINTVVLETGRLQRKW